MEPATHVAEPVAQGCRVNYVGAAIGTRSAKHIEAGFLKVAAARGMCQGMVTKITRRPPRRRAISATILEGALLPRGLKRSTVRVGTDPREAIRNWLNVTGARSGRASRHHLSMLWRKFVLQNRSDLVFDIGVYNGDDTAYYLSKGLSCACGRGRPSLVEVSACRLAHDVHHRCRCCCEFRHRGAGCWG